MSPANLRAIEAWIADIFNEASPRTPFSRGRSLCNFIAFIHFHSRENDPNAAKLVGDYLSSLYIIGAASKIEPSSETASAIVSELVSDGIVLASLTKAIHEPLSSLVINFIDSKRLGYFPADVVRFLLSYDPATVIAARTSGGSNTARRNATKKRPKSRPASIKKAHYFFVETSGFGNKQQFGWTTFNEKWMAAKDVCFFHYVNVHHFKSRLDLRPGKGDFAAQIDEILSDTLGLKTFFCKSKFAFEELKKRMDPRATDSMKFPKLPKGFESEATRDAALSREAMAQMANYTSTSVD